MTDARQDFGHDYRESFTAYLAGGGESGLRAAYELGRTAMVRKLSVLDIAAIHHEVLFDALRARPDGASLDAAAEAASTFVLEVLATYEMVQRGVEEAHETARLEQHYAEQLRRLAEASLAISAAGRLEEIVQLVAEHAVRVLDAAASATVTVDSDRCGRLEGTYPPGVGDRGRGAGIDVPLLRPNRTPFGELSVVGSEGRTYNGKDEAILAQLARLTAVAIENAELYEQERLVAETLQRGLLPGGLPVYPGAVMTSRYLPGWADGDIGGDWYDAIVLADGRLALAVGDVMGKGIRAAAGMGQLRVAVRAYTIEGHDPAVVVQRLDQAVESLDMEFATAVYLVFDRATSTLRYANAGHPPPLLLAPDGSIQALDAGLSPPLGAILGLGTVEARADVVPGSTLVVYTDGLVERRGSDLERGLRQLREVLASGDATDLDKYADYVLAGMDADNRGDDIALLVARLGEATGPAAT